jgi:hypothetical protein
MDLTTAYPRSPRATIAGLAMAARAADKARAQAAGTIGDYNYDCPMDNKLFAFVGTNGEEFLAAVTSTPDDHGAEQLLTKKLAGKSADEIAAYNHSLVEHQPQAGTDGCTWFLAGREKNGRGRTDIFTWTDLIDVEEGREVAHRSDTPDWAKAHA